MIWTVRFAAILVLTTAIQATSTTTSQARSCTLVSGTADGFTKSQALSRSRVALSDYIANFKKQKGWRRMSISPAKAPPNPYWRSKVSGTLYLKPDLQTSKEYTICWEGVISPAVCTSGARICG